MELKVKVHADLLSEIVSTRYKNDRYQTNKKIKFVAFYYVLKSLTTTGIIKNFRGQIDYLTTALNCSTPTFYHYLKQAQKLGYLRKTGKGANNIVLASYANFAETFDSVYTQFVNIDYKPLEQKFYMCLEAAFLQVKEWERERTFESKIKALPELRRELQNVVSPDNNGNYAKGLQALQIDTFKYGHEKKDIIFYLNPFLDCNTKTLRNQFKLKSEQSVAYLKGKLQRAKLVTVTPTRIPSQTNQRLKQKFIEWDSKTKQTILVMPDRLQVAPLVHG